MTLLTAWVMLACTSAPMAPMATVASVDLNRYLGNWYEIALLPNRFQKMCVADTMANYSLQPSWTGDSIRVVNQCRTANGSLEVAQGVAKVADEATNAKLRVSFFRPFYGNYWVLALGSNYEWVLVGEPSRQYGWVLSRTPKLDDEVLSNVLQRAASLGYQTEGFVKTPQTQALK